MKKINRKFVALFVGASLVSQVEAVDIHDTCASAFVVTSMPYAGTFDTTLATSSGDPALYCSVGVANGIWFVYTPAEGGLLTVHTTGSSFDTAIGVFKGVCGALTAYSCNDDDGDEITSSLDVVVNAGETIRFLIGGYDGATGELVVSLSLDPNAPIVAGDTCDRALEILHSPFIETLDTTNATNAGPPCGDVRLGSGVWFTLLAPVSGLLKINLEGSAIDTGLGLYKGSCGSLSEVDCDGNGNGDLTSLINTSVTGGTRYYIRCGGIDGEQGRIEMELIFEICPSCENDTDLDGLKDSVDLDDDNDVMPDVWELARGLNPQLAADGLLDVDVDGFNNTDEYIAGTVHTNALSYIQFELPIGVGDSGQVPVRFHSVSGRVYQIDYRPSLFSGAWQFGPSGIVGDGTTQTIPLPVDNPRQYIRLGVKLAP